MPSYLRSLFSVTQLELWIYVLTLLIQNIYKITLAGYVNQLRIGRASRLLAQSNEKITGIASACGFTNLANFNQKFQLQHGMTPRAYRRQTQGAAESAGPPLPEPGHVNRKRA